ncbi:hybrid sensor histidine kinase/response regulator [Rhizobium halophilum]|uniref:hybrid sensor histidine kinase/response regulator n=1 Tax=Rhizobium halophilum TaxID=2846852 RepID=UPI001EFDB0E6|nr:PAS domain-containing sensor histidine kinase [Rhizobium halophilum]MCF6371153.1 PAS domain S-box protein [Rhizobium halophilum]
MSARILFIGTREKKTLVGRAAELVSALLIGDAATGKDADVVVFGDEVEDVLSQARDLLQHAAASPQIVFMLPASKLKRIRASLPFVPRLASAWTVDAASTPQGLAEVLQAALEEGSRRNSIAQLKDRINLQIGNVRQSEAKQAGELRARQLLVSESYLATLLAQAPDAFLALDPGGRVTAFNAAAADLFGLMPNDGVGHPVADVLPAGIVDDLERGLQSARTGGRGSGQETVLDLGGRLRTFEVSFAPIRGAVDEFLGASISLHEVTDRIAAERGLRESELRFRTVTESLPQLVWTCDPEGNCDYFSRQWLEYTGIDEAMQLGLGWLDLVVHPDDRERTREHWFGAVEGRHPYDIDYRIRESSGTYRWFKTRGTPIHSADGTINHWFGTCTDIQEIVEAREILLHDAEVLEQRVAAEIAARNEAEEALRQAQKMEALGQLTGGVAHDFNNLLQVISGNLHLLGKDVAGNERAERRLANALAGVSRGSKLANQLLAFGRRQPLDPRVVNLGRLISDMGDMLQRTLGEAVEVEIIRGGGLWNTLVDPAQIENAILNLAINARDAMDGQGKLTIEVANALLDDAYARSHAEVRAGQYVMICVTDTGSGMTQEVLEKVFQPFYSTKPVGKGTGLGLSMVYGFVKQSGGHVKIDSEVGHGTSVHLYLPRSAQAEDAPANSKVGPVAGGTETILVAEDDEEVRATVIDLLHELGYRVLTAKDAESALSIIESGIPIDLLFTDVVMPGPLRSSELARKARQLIPGISVLFTSGYAENAIVHEGKLDAGVKLLSKPYSREELARKIRQVLDQGGQKT